jgi:hypothetical protein
MSDKKHVQRLFAYILMTVGALITLLCGGCTVIYLGSVIWTIFLNFVPHDPLAPELQFDAPNGALLGFYGIIIGGLPTAVGVVMFLGGRRMRRRAMAPSRRGLDSTYS